MVRKVTLIVMLVLIPGLVLGAAVKVIKAPIQNLPLTSGDEVVNASVVMPPYALRSVAGTDQIVGDTLTIGTTWYENQHNGTIGRMVEKSDDGYLHFVWMNGLNSGASDRHVYYQYIDPTGAQGWPYTGYAVETSTRAGYTVLDVDYGGIAFPSFHQITTSPLDQPHTAVATDFFPHAGAFLVYEPTWIDEGGVDLAIIWPRLQFDRNGFMHIVSTENPYQGVPGDPQRQYYCKGTYDPGTWNISFTPFELISWTMTIAADVATSEVSDRVAFAWTWSREEGFPGGDPNQYNNDIYVLIDDDGQDFNWGDAFNLTQFIPPDTAWLPDSLMADMDTIRAYTDLNIFVDQNDYVHVAFTTPGYYELEGLITVTASLIWHWSEQFPGEWQLVANHWYGNYTPGAWNRNVQRPSLGEDPSTGYLYCMYQVYDSTTVSAGGYPSGEVYISVSTDGGATWSQGINVTNTISPMNANPGECLSELTPTMAKLVDGTCHVMYVLDRDAGFVVQNEGTWTFNEVKYHSVPVGLIPTTPLQPQDVPFHVEHGPPVGIPGTGIYDAPKSFALKQNYPNPFNPTTSITFSLDEVSDVTLSVHNLKGENVATVTSGTYGTGEHTVSFDAANLASGLYVYRLEAGDRALQKKMLLVK